jgi:hypothetical protein
MLHSILRLRDVRMAVVLVDPRQLLSQADRLIAEMQLLFKLPVMLVARDDSAWNGARARAEFDAVPYLYALLAIRDDVEWAEMPPIVEPDLPF